MRVIHWPIRRAIREQDGICKMELEKMKIRIASHARF